MIATIIQAATHSMLCHLQKLLKPCPRRSSSVWALMLGPMMTARKLEKQQGPRSRYRPDGSRRRTQGKLQQRRKAKEEGTGFWATPRRLTAPRQGEPVQNRSQTWQDRDGVGCGTIGGLLRQHQNLRAPGPGTHSKPGARQGKTGSEIAPPARKIGVMTGSGKATGIAPARALLHRIQLGDFKKFHTSFHTDLACSQVPRRTQRPRRKPWAAPPRPHHGAGRAAWHSPK